MPTITDSLFSLIIFIYVMITFLYLFYGFCWREPPKLTEEQKKELAKQVNDMILPNTSMQVSNGNRLNPGGAQSQANGSP